jgi:hypothetical protein
MEGLKNRWFTDRTSTETFTGPTSPSADPKPVIERSMAEEKERRDEAEGAAKMKVVADQRR